MIEVEYLGSDPLRVRSTKNSWGLVVATLSFGILMMLLGLFGLWGSRRFPELSENPPRT